MRKTQLSCLLLSVFLWGCPPSTDNTQTEPSNSPEASIAPSTSASENPTNQDNFQLKSQNIINHLKDYQLKQKEKSAYPES